MEGMAGVGTAAALGSCATVAVVLVELEGGPESGVVSRVRQVSFTDDGMCDG